MANDASSGVGNSSAQTVEAHVPREWEEPASEALREGWREAEVCAEEVAAPREPMRGRFSAEAAPASSGSSYRQGRRKAASGISSTAQSKAPSGGATCRTSTIATCILPNQLHREAAPQRKAKHHRGVTAGRETARLHREAASQRKARRHRDTHPAAMHPREAATAREGAKLHREAAPQRKAKHLRDEQPVEPAPSGGATYRTSSIGKSTFCQIMVPKGQVLRG